MDTLPWHHTSTALPLALLLELDDFFALAVASLAALRLCQEGASSVHLPSFNGASAIVLQRLLRSRITGNGTGIREINASMCPSVDTAVLQGLPKLPALQVLNLDGCQGVDDAGLIAVAQRCQSLRSLGLYWNVRVTDKGICRVLKAQAGKELQFLNFSGVKNLGDETIQRIVTKADKLEHLDLTRCPSISDAGIHMVCECCEQLRVLRLYAMAQISPPAFISLRRLTELEELDLCGCRIGDDAVVGLLDAMVNSKLHTLNLTWCFNLTDASLLAVARTCPLLVWFSVFGNLNMTSSALEALAATPCGRSIRSIDVRGLMKASPYHQDVLALRQLFPTVVDIELHH